MLNVEVAFNLGLSGFDVRKAKCFMQEDRERILSVIEAGFGDLELFNHLVCRFVAKHMEYRNGTASDETELETELESI